MVNSYQNEIPKARVNITLDVDTGGFLEKKELPLKLLAMGNFSHSNSKTAIASRERININKNNFDQIIGDLAPSLKINVPNTIAQDDSELQLNLKFKSLKDFQPDNIINQVSELRRLLAMRNLLRDLKANLLDNKSFRSELEKIITDGSQLQMLKLALQDRITD